MATEITQKRPRRQKSALPQCYYEGYLEKRSPKEKKSHKLWTCLCGNTLFFFNTSKDKDYTEKLELSGFISLTDDSSRGTNLDAARFILRMKDGEFQLTAPSLEARELWKGYISSVVELAVPSSLNLLPGQVHMLAEAIETEKKRRQTPSTPPPAPAPVPPEPKMPSCYYSVSRIEAELLLQRKPEYGNFLLRPGRDGSSLAVTTYQDLSGPVFRHYRVTGKPDGGFSIEVENPVPCATLHDVINYMVEKTAGSLRPFILEEAYDDNITFVLDNVENGEKSLQCARSGPSSAAPVPPPKPGCLTDREPSEDMDSSLIYINCPGDGSPVARSPTLPSKTVTKAQLFKRRSFLSFLSGRQNGSASGNPVDENSSASTPTPQRKPGKKARLPKQHSVGWSPPSEGQSNSNSGNTEEGNSSACSPAPPPQTEKKALLPKNPSFGSSSALDGQSSNATAGEIKNLKAPIPTPRSIKGTEAPGKGKEAIRPSHAGDPRVAVISEELKKKLVTRQAKH